MNVLLINGSPRKKGCTFTALSEVAATLEKEGIATEIFHIGIKPVMGCMGCNGCRKIGQGKCAFVEDVVNDALEKAKNADGFVFGTPVHYAAAAGMMSSFLDRFFYASNGAFAYKPGASVISCRRSGATATFDELNKYLTISQMPVVSSHYWNMVHGNTPEEVKQDLEGMQVLRQLGRNMAWMLKCIETGKQHGIGLPEQEERVKTNFIR